MRQIIVLFFTAIVLFPVPVFAQQNAERHEELFQEAMTKKQDQKYKEMVDEIYAKGVANGVEYGALRVYYPATSHYVAFSEPVINQMMDYAYTIEHEQDPQKVNEAIAGYNGLVRWHFANLEVLFLASSLAQDEARLGDADFYKQLAEGLYKSILAVYDGSSPEKAVQINTFGEEDIILKRTPGKLISSKMHEQGQQFTNIHKFQDMKTGNVRTLYFNVSKPITKMQDLRAKQEKKKQRKRG